MTKNSEIGDQGESEVVNNITCPNCSSKLILLPKGFPIYDIQCSRCLFRAQIKTALSKPKSTIFGAGWQILDKVLKAGYLMPPLIVNFKWRAQNGGVNQEIRFYPFIAIGHIQKYRLSEKAKRSNYWMFKYIKLDRAPYISLYSQRNPLGKVIE